MNKSTTAQLGAGSFIWHSRRPGNAAPQSRHLLSGQLVVKFKSGPSTIGSACPRRGNGKIHHA